MAVIGRGRPPGCADVRRAFGEGLHATAPEQAASWLLVEHAGPWPSEGLPPDLPPEAATALEQAEEAGSARSWYAA